MKCKFCQQELVKSSPWEWTNTKLTISKLDSSEWNCQTPNCNFFCYQEPDGSYHKYGFTYNPSGQDDEEFILAFDSDIPKFMVSKGFKRIFETYSIPDINPSNVAKRLPIFILFS